MPPRLHWRGAWWLLAILAIGRWSMVAVDAPRYFHAMNRVDSELVAANPLLNGVAITVLFGLLFLATAAVARQRAVQPSTTRLVAAHLAAGGLYLLLLACTIQIGKGNALLWWIQGVIPTDSFLAVIFLRAADPPWGVLAYLAVLFALPVCSHWPRGRLWLLPIGWLGLAISGPVLSATPKLAALFGWSLGLIGLSSWVCRPAALPWWGQAAPILMGAISLLSPSCREPGPLLVIFQMGLINLGVMGMAHLLQPAVDRSWPLSWLVPFLTLGLAAAVSPVHTHLVRFLIAVTGLPLLPLPEAAVMAGAWWLAWRWPRPALQRIVSLLAAAYVVLTLVDLQVFRLLGIRLSWRLLDFAGHLTIAFASIRPYLTLPTLGLAAAVLALGQDWSAQSPRQWLQVPRRPIGILLVVLGWIAMAVFLHPGMPTYVSPLWWQGAAGLAEKLAVKRGNSAPPDQILRDLDAILPFSDQSPVSRFPTGHHLLLVICESMHTRYLSLYGAPFATQPGLASFTSRMRLFTRIHCNFLSSEHANFAILNALHPPAETVGDLAPELTCPSLIRILAEAGYSVGYFYPGDNRYQNFANWLVFQPLAHCYDQFTLPGRDQWGYAGWGIDERGLRQAIFDHIRESQARRERFAVIYRSLTPHHPFPLLDPAYRIFVPTVEEVAAGTDIRPRYLNQLLFIDDVFAGLLHDLQTAGLLDSTLVVFIADHGESLAEAGRPHGHGFLLAPDLTNVFCVMLEPGRTTFLRDETLGSQVDLMPTILEALGLPMPAGHPYQGRSLFGPRPSHPLVVSSYQDRALVTPEHFVRLPEQGLPEWYRVRAPERTEPPDFDLSPQPFPATKAAAAWQQAIKAFEARQREFILRYAEIQPVFAAGAWRTATAPAAPFADLASVLPPTP
ncbi:MAG: putative sulfatase [Candidatus Ozemobacter sibiricus]|uniref:Putative sulfatase n=1 Tax=Candidatus Ozemobacter sibiricus TaxID=2268124 RepID=A0A367ZJA8_9BACT|nr:MAG: putative sulfatase [Candidatus Ozemobacter sibiricus]